MLSQNHGKLRIKENVPPQLYEKVWKKHSSDPQLPEILYFYRVWQLRDWNIHLIGV